MTPTPETVLRGEIAGLAVRVVAAGNADLVGIEGEVVRETMRTLVVGTDGRVATVPKAGTTFAFVLPGGERVTVEGRRLVARPARRTETAGGSIWHSD